MNALQYKMIHLKLNSINHNFLLFSKRLLTVNYLFTIIFIIFDFEINYPEYHVQDAHQACSLPFVTWGIIVYSNVGIFKYKNTQKQNMH